MFTANIRRVNNVVTSGARLRILPPRFFSSTSQRWAGGPQNPRGRVLRNRFIAGVGFGAVGGVLYALFAQGGSSRLKLDAPPLSSDLVDLQPPTKTDKFPGTISINQTIFQALGTGVRTVTFINLHVYAVGLYIAADDVLNARKVLTAEKEKYGNPTTRDEWYMLLTDNEKGTQIIDDLLRANVRLAVRIVPVRNTDFNHMRDGFVRSVTNRIEAKAINSAEFGGSVNEIKRAFSRKRKLKSGEVVTWARDINGGMSAWYGDTDESKELLGSPPDPDVARLFFLQYLTGPKPNSPTLKARGIGGLVDVVIDPQDGGL